MIKSILLVGAGGAMGSISRWLCQRWVNYNYPHAFPWGTFAVNIIGCFLIGIFWGIAFKGFAANENWKLFLMTGLCGGFTTFSAFTLDGIGLLKENRAGVFFFYAAGTVCAGLALTWLGMRIVK
jgi:CrcB protein